MGPDRRDSQRLTILGTLHGEVMRFQPMEVIEVGEGGATVETTFPLQLNSVHELRLTLRDRSIVIKGRVVHSQISDVSQETVTYLTGLQFVDTAERTKEALAEYISTTRSSRSSV